MHDRWKFFAQEKENKKIVIDWMAKGLKNIAHCSTPQQ
jgi:hypothetical protein